MITPFIEVGTNVIVAPHAVVAVQGRLVDELKGNITITTLGGNVVLQSADVVVDVARIRKQVEEALAGFNPGAEKTRDILKG